jgi:hypothetical protein
MHTEGIFSSEPPTEILKNCPRRIEKVSKKTLCPACLNKPLTKEEEGRIFEIVDRVFPLEKDKCPK